MPQKDIVTADSFKSFTGFFLSQKWYYKLLSLFIILFIFNFLRIFEIIGENISKPHAEAKIYINIANDLNLRACNLLGAFIGFDNPLSNSCFFISESIYKTGEGKLYSKDGERLIWWSQTIFNSKYKQIQPAIEIVKKDSKNLQIREEFRKKLSLFTDELFDKLCSFETVNDTTDLNMRPFYLKAFYELAYAYITIKEASYEFYYENSREANRHFLKSNYEVTRLKKLEEIERLVNKQTSLQPSTYGKIETTQEWYLKPLFLVQLEYYLLLNSYKESSTTLNDLCRTPHYLIFEENLDILNERSKDASLNADTLQTLNQLISKEGYLIFYNHCKKL